MSKKKDAVTIKIESCLACPNHGIERDPSSGDSFDAYDTALVCLKAPPPPGQADDAPWRKDWPPCRAIVSYSRNPASEYEREKVGIPAWCPLRKKKVAD